MGSRLKVHTHHFKGLLLMFIEDNLKEKKTFSLYNYKSLPS
jgi:hypothetical protein